ncbi:hypothetical protein [Streptomyces sp. NPDC001401]|uniref:hypothetical protein n=1 Tax=Streptomyces sp. NPDC001401 TaxID=3364570 RepID=UPI0036820C92
MITLSREWADQVCGLCPGEQDHAVRQLERPARHARTSARGDTDPMPTYTEE